MSESDVIAEGKAAWSAISTATTFASWKAIAAALEVGRLCSMRDAKINVAYGTRYRRAMSAWAAENGFADMPFSYRSACHVLASNLPAIERWRNALPPEKRANHIQVVIRNWKRATSPSRLAESRPAKDAKSASKSSGNVQPVHWPQDFVNRAFTRMVDSRSSDLLTLARRSLEGAIRNRDDLIALLETTTPSPIRKPKAAPPIAAPEQLLPA